MSWIRFAARCLYISSWSASMPHLRLGELASCSAVKYHLESSRARLPLLLLVPLPLLDPPALAPPPTPDAIEWTTEVLAPGYRYPLAVDQAPERESSDCNLHPPLRETPYTLLITAYNAFMLLFSFSLSEFSLEIIDCIPSSKHCFNSS